MARFPVILNGDSGAVTADPQIASKVGEALEAAGLDADVEIVAGDECQRRFCAIAKSGCELLVVGGGDGTVSTAAAVLADTEILLGILPLGTLNHFARDLGIPMAFDLAAKLIAGRNEHRVDIGLMNERIFINNSAIGLYPLMVVDRDLQQRKLGRSKRLAMSVAALRTLLRFNHQRLTLKVNDEQARIDTPLLFVGNNEYRIDIGAPGRRDSIESGKLSLFVMRKKTRRGFIAATIRVLLGRIRNDDMVRVENVEELFVSSRRTALSVSLDGEIVRANPPLDYKIRKQALRVIAP